jgi:hypothetical protein
VLVRIQAAEAKAYGLPALLRGSTNTGENNPNYDFVAPRDKVTVTNPVVRRAHNRPLC